MSKLVYANKPVQHRWTCHLCTQVFSRKAILQDHLNVHDDKKPHICGICNTAFARKNDRKRHQDKHSSAEKKTCEHCPKTFTRIDSYRKHVRRYHSETVSTKPAASEQKPVAVSFSQDQGLNSLDAQSTCLLTQAVTPKLQDELSWGEGQLPYGWDFVDLPTFSPFDEFLLANSLTEIHSPNRRCSICQQHVLDAQDLKEHLEGHLSDANGPPKHACPDCPTKFHYQFQLAAHQEALKRLANGDAKDFVCDCCGETFGKLYVFNHTRLWIHLGFGANPQSSICRSKRVSQDKVLKDQIEQQIKEVLKDQIEQQINEILESHEPIQISEH
jgi:Zinc finger, C2H2 type